MKLLQAGLIWLELSAACVFSATIGDKPPVPAKALQTSAPAALVFKTAWEVHSMTPEEAANGYPVHLRGRVTYYDPYIDARHGAMFVCDQTGCIFAAIP